MTTDDRAGLCVQVSVLRFAIMRWKMPRASEADRAEAARVRAEWSEARGLERAANRRAGIGVKKLGSAVHLLSAPGPESSDVATALDAKRAERWEALDPE